MQKKTITSSKRLAAIDLSEKGGWSIVEILAALAIISLVIASTVQASLKSLQIFNQGAAREGIEQVISEDLGWLRAFSKSWHCQVGPYEGCITKANGIASAVNYLPEIYSEDTSSDYYKFKLLCTNRNQVKSGAATPASQLLVDASLINSGNYQPPNPVPTIESKEVLINLNNAPAQSKAYKIYRTLKSIPTTTEEEAFLTGNAILVNYYTKSSDRPYMRIQRIEQLFIEAAAWCP
jgi:type II secretory pathway pseudopilin PulG